MPKNHSSWETEGVFEELRSYFSAESNQLLDNKEGVDWNSHLFGGNSTQYLNTNPPAQYPTNPPAQYPTNTLPAHYFSTNTLPPTQYHLLTTPLQPYYIYHPDPATSQWHYYHPATSSLGETDRAIQSGRIPDAGPHVLYHGHSEPPVGTHLGPYEGVGTTTDRENGQIPSAAACQQATSPVTFQKQGDTDAPGAYSGQQQLTKAQPEVARTDTEKRTHKSGSRKSRRRHVLHTAEKPFHCEHCDKRFNQLRHLTSHLRLHTGEKPFQCEGCDKSFLMLGDLNRHARVHTGEKHFHCKQCDKSFSRLDSLVKHQFVHTGEKKFHCDQCDKRFSQSSNLNTHLRLHAGKRPFFCNDCDKSFSLLSHLKSHRLQHTGEKPFQCKLCDKSYTRSSHLKTHQRLHT